MKRYHIHCTGYPDGQFELSEWGNDVIYTFDTYEEAVKVAQDLLDPEAEDVLTDDYNPDEWQRLKDWQQEVKGTPQEEVAAERLEVIENGS